MNLKAKYFSMRIISGALNYNFVISLKPELKDDIDTYLKEKGREDLIESTVE